MSVIHRLTFNQTILLVIIATVFLNEFLIYWINSVFWPSFVQKSASDVTVLFISDPQLQGYEDEPPFPMGTINRWDADRYLRNNFNLIFGKTNPDVIVYLGDLFDEGSKATASDYLVYYQRFKSIFSLAAAKTNIYLAGDNDIGGEGYDRKTLKKVHRFEKYFANLSEVIHVKFLDFIKVDFTSSFKTDQTIKLIKGMRFKSPLRIFLDHNNVLIKRKPSLFTIFHLIRPRMIFSGHWHESVHWVCEDCLSGSAFDGIWPLKRVSDPLVDEVTLNLLNDSQINEVMVPTCSYRMGVANIGYGVAQFSPMGLVMYRVLWIPGRYTILYLYLIVITIIIICCIIRRSSKTLRSLRHLHYR